MRTDRPRIVARVATAIQADVDWFTSRHRRRIEAAVWAGLGGLDAKLVGRARPEPKVDDVFRQIGWAAGDGDRPYEGLVRAFDVASRALWQEWNRVASTQQLRGGIVCEFVNLLFEHVDHLREVVATGYRAGHQNYLLRTSRELLGRRLIAGCAVDEIKRLARLADWDIPDAMVVGCLRAPAPAAPDLLAAEESFEPDVLILADPPYVLLVCDARTQDSRLNRARDVLDCEYVAASVVSPADQITDAIRLAKVAHQLVESGRILQTQVVECSHHELALWLQSEPALRDGLARRLLAPLEAETPHRREVLAQTLLVWLEQRASATIMARQLGVHPQTVRNRMRRLAALFPDLRDPAFTVPALMTLKATLPT